MPPTAIPTISDVARIAALPDPVLRNLQITQCYHELALVMAERSGWNANWCTFATWASKQAGQTIRKEDLGRALAASLGSQAAAEQATQELETAARRLGAKLGIEEILKIAWKAYDPQGAFERSNEAVARGNLKVFAEIAYEFARFYSDCLPDPVFKQESITSFCKQLHPGDPPDGQDYLRRAFQHYYQALFEEEAKARIELLLLGNLEIGFHEQTRLQPEINEALVAPIILPEVFARNLLKALRPGWGWINEAIWLVMRLFGRLTELDQAIEVYVNWAQRQAQFIVTEMMMAIELPGHGRLRLGDDLSAGYPPILQNIDHPELRDLLARIDPTPDSTSASGAEYWGDLPDRIHFIAELFRCYETAQALLEPPFSTEQTTALKEGRLPAGQL